MARRDLDEWLWQVGAELERLSEELTPTGPKFARRSTWAPRVDVAETDDHLLVRAELAGARGEDIRVMLSEDGRRLTIKGTRGPQDVVDDASNRYHQLEIDFGDFERVVNLPDRALEPRGVRAQYRNGFLVVVLPKRASQGGHVVKKRISVRISAPDSDPTP